MMSRDHGYTHAIVEAPREVIEYLNRGPLLKLFDKTGYCIYHDVVVCQQGNKDRVLQQIEDASQFSPSDLRVAQAKDKK